MSPARRAQVVALLVAGMRRQSIAEILPVSQADVDHIYATLSYIDARAVAYEVTGRRNAWPTQTEAERFVERFSYELSPEIIVDDARDAVARAERYAARARRGAMPS